MAEAPHLRRFFDAFAARDAAGMNACYAPDASFDDPVFPGLRGDEVRAMWSMLLRGASADFRVRLVEAEETEGGDGTIHGRARWVANYTFSRTGRPVENHVTSEVVLRDGKIVTQRDTFALDRWLAQALGVPGRLLGGFGFFQNYFRKQARKGIVAELRR